MQLKDCTSCRKTTQATGLTIFFIFLFFSQLWDYASACVHACVGLMGNWLMVKVDFFLFGTLFWSLLFGVAVSGESHRSRGAGVQGYSAEQIIASPGQSREQGSRLCWGTKLLLACQNPVQGGRCEGCLKGFCCCRKPVLHSAVPEPAGGRRAAHGLRQPLHLAGAVC